MLDILNSSRLTYHAVEIPRTNSKVLMAQMGRTTLMVVRTGMPSLLSRKRSASLEFRQAWMQAPNSSHFTDADSSMQLPYR